MRRTHTIALRPRFFSEAMKAVAMTSTKAAKSALRDNEIAIPRNVAADHQIALRFPSRYSARNQPRQMTERIADGRTARSGPTRAVERIAARMNTLVVSWK